jgi:probable F420-dependent oxidoreductase
MKVRIGFGLGTNSQTNDPTRLGPLIADLERLGFDSAWFSERVSGTSLDPIVAMTWAVARTEKLKFGTSVMVVPGRNPVLLAKSLASLDRLSNGRVHPAVGLGAVNLAEHQAFGVRREDRGSWFDEALPLMRRLWTEDDVTHHGEHFNLDGVTVLPKPVQDPFEIWLGGAAKSELRRIGRVGDGWLPSFCVPADVAEGIPYIDEHTEAAGRPLISREHFGAMIAYSADGSIPQRIVDAVRLRRPELDPTDVVLTGRDGLEDRMRQFLEAGASKFVVTPYTEPADWHDELEAIAEAVLHLQN